MKIATILAATTAVLLSLNAAQAQEKLKIGVVTTLSGPPAVLGGQLRKTGDRLDTIIQALVVETGNSRRALGGDHGASP